MKFKWTTIFGFYQYIKTGFWEVKFVTKTSKSEIIRHLNRLFKNELAKEIRNGLANFPFAFKGIPPIEVKKDKVEESYRIEKDNDGFVSALLHIFEGQYEGEKLCFNLNNKGFNCDYFCFRAKGDNKHIELKPIISGTSIPNCGTNHNVRRLIGTLFETYHPYLNMWLERPGMEIKEEVLPDYKDEERNKMLKYRCGKYPGQKDYE